MTLKLYHPPQVYPDPQTAPRNAIGRALMRAWMRSLEEVPAGLHACLLGQPGNLRGKTGRPRLIRRRSQAGPQLAEDPDPVLFGHIWSLRTPSSFPEPLEKRRQLAQV